MKFEHEKLLDLPDGQVDEDHLKEVFTTLGFNVKPHQNCKKIDITSKLKEYAKLDHEGKALIVIILSHGGEGDVVYGTDGGEVKMHDLQELFSAVNCPSLQNAPKMFLFDACRGTNDETGLSNSQQGKGGGITTGYPVITNSLNFATVFASTRGNTAGMFPADSEESGSYFTQTLIEVIKAADEDKEFNEIITEVRYKILKRAQEMAQAPKQKVKSKGLEQEVKPQEQEKEVMAKGPEQEVKVQDPEQEVKAQDPGQEVKAQDPEQEVKAKDPEQKVKAQDPGQEVMAKGPEQEVMAKGPEQEVNANNQKRKEITTQTVQYTSTLLRLYFIKRNSNK